MIVGGITSGVLERIGEKVQSINVWSSHDFKENHTFEKIAKYLITRFDTGMRGSEDFKRITLKVLEVSNDIHLKLKTVLLRVF